MIFSIKTNISIAFLLLNTLFLYQNAYAQTNNMMPIEQGFDTNNSAISLFCTSNYALGVDARQTLKHMDWYISGNLNTPFLANRYDADYRFKKDAFELEKMDQDAAPIAAILKVGILPYRYQFFSVGVGGLLEGRARTNNNNSWLAGFDTHLRIQAKSGGLYSQLGMGIVWNTKEKQDAIFMPEFRLGYTITDRPDRVLDAERKVLYGRQHTVYLVKHMGEQNNLLGMGYEMRFRTKSRFFDWAVRGDYGASSRVNGFYTNNGIRYYAGKYIMANLGIMGLWGKRALALGVGVQPSLYNANLERLYKDYRQGANSIQYETNTHFSVLIPIELRYQPQYGGTYFSFGIYPAIGIAPVNRGVGYAAFNWGYTFPTK
jgi:hypothetical protein